MQRMWSSKLLPILCLVSISGLLLLSMPELASSQEPAAHRATITPPAPPRSGTVVEGKGVTGPAIYIIRLEGEPLASYRGGVTGLNATSPQATGANKLNIQSAASVAYRRYLGQQRSLITQAVAQTIGRTPQVIYEYDVAFNGMAVRLTAAEAAGVSRLAGVASVRPDAWRQPTTSVSPDFIGATQIWNGTATGGLPGTKGQGIIVGVIDSGIWPEHPSFAGAGFPRRRPVGAAAALRRPTPRRCTPAPTSSSACNSSSRAMLLLSAAPTMACSARAATTMGTGRTRPRPPPATRVSVRRSLAYRAERSRASRPAAMSPHTKPSARRAASPPT